MQLSDVKLGVVQVVVSPSLDTKNVAPDNTQSVTAFVTGVSTPISPTTNGQQPEPLKEY